MAAPIQLFGKEIPLQVVDLNVGLLLFLALSSIAVYGVALVSLLAAPGHAAVQACGSGDAAHGIQAIGQRQRQ